METRFDINPGAYKAMMALESYLAETTLSKTLKELIKIRASQINHCAFCIDMHTKDALKKGETPQRIFLLNAWREAPEFFTEEERTVLAIAEEVTLIHQQGLSNDTYQKALKFFSENQIAEIIMAVVTINAWNRIAISAKTKISD